MPSHLPATPPAGTGSVSAPASHDDQRAAADAETRSLADTVAALSRRLDEVAASSQLAVKQSDNAAAAADAAKGATQSEVQRSDIDGLSSRMTALEGAMRTLSDDVSRRTASADDRAARLTVTAEALRSAVERGASYQAELAAVQALGVGESATAALAPFSATGVPNADALARELDGLIPAIEHASDTAPAATTFLGRLEASARKLVRVTPADAPAGDTPPAILDRIRIDAARSDVDAAMSEIDALPLPAQAPAADWLARAKARKAAIAASRQIVAEALTALGKP
jgi:hypothetical protein